MNSLIPKYFLLIFTFLFLISCKSQNKSTIKTVDNFSNKKGIISNSQIDSAQVMADIKYLASDELQGRRSGEKGNETARKYIVTKYEELGLEKFGESYLQPFSFYKRFTKKVYDCNNIIGKIKGTKHPEKYIVKKYLMAQMTMPQVFLPSLPPPHISKKIHQNIPLFLSHLMRKN